MNKRMWVPLLATLVALGFLTLDSAQRWKTLDFVNRTSARIDSPAPAPDPTSPSGYRWSQHAKILPFYVDCYNWIQQTQLMLAGAGWRIREVDYDRVPEGREVHWSGSFRWWLALLASIDHACNGTPLPLAVERVAPLASPLLLACAILLLVPVLAIRFGGAAAGLCALAMVAVFDFYQNFLMGNPDHHGMVSLCCLATVLCLVAGGAGWIRVEPDGPDGNGSDATDGLRRWLPRRPMARRWFIASALAGGTGLWISAATVVPVLLSVGLGGVLATGWLARKPGGANTPQGAPTPCAVRTGISAEPSLWLEWGAVGAAVSLFFYLLEYFPFHFGWRLEVNHPLYALAWLGGGSLISLASRDIAAGKPLRAPRTALHFSASLFALTALPLTIALTHEKTFFVADAFLWTLHVNYISEFQSLPRYLAQLPLRPALASVSLLPLLAVPLLLLLANSGAFRPLRAMAAVVLPAGIVMTLLGLKQVRWLGIADAVWLAGLVVAVWAVTTPATAFVWTRRRQILGLVFLAGLFAPHALHASRSWFGAPAPGPADYFQAVVRDVAHWLRQRVGETRVAVLSGPSVGSMLAYHGGFRAEGSLYWENLGGLKDASAIFSASDPEQARALLKSRGIGYIVIVSWDAFDEEYARLAHQLGSKDAVPGDAFIHQIIRSRRLPKWLRPLPYPSGALPRPRMGRDFFLGIFEIVPDQSDAEAGVRNAQFLMAIGAGSSARPHLDVALAARPEYLPALLTLARLGDSGSEALMARIRLQLPSAGALEWGDRVDLALLLQAAGDTVEASRQLAACWTTATESGVRSLRPEACFALLDLTRRLTPPITDERLAAIAFELLPPRLQARHLFESALKEHLAAKPAAAISLYRRALSLDPAYPSALNNLAMILASSFDPALRHGAEALELARRAARSENYRQPGTLDTLACAAAAAGDFKHAAFYARRALNLAEVSGPPSLADDIRGHLVLFESGRPYHEPPGLP
jgi:tetratricopeptide (TPR) repeat protein